MNDSLIHLEQVAQLTHAKDRDATDTALVEVLHTLLRHAVVSLVEVFNLNDQVRCLLRAHLAPGMVAPSSTSALTRPEDLDPLEQFPHRVACLQSRKSGVFLVEGSYRLVVPVFAEGERELLVEVLFTQRPKPAMVRLVEGVARIYQNFLSLLDYSERDSLTSLLNRKSFDETFFKATRATVVAAADSVGDGKRLEHPLSVHWLGVIDIDHFKSVNDRYGHLIGDEVLLLLARVMRSTFRHDDRLYRFGGEEFVVLLRADDESSAQAIFERFRSNL